MRSPQRLQQWATAYNLPNVNEVASPNGVIPSPSSRDLVDFNGLAYRDVATNELQQLRTSKIASSSRLSLFASDQLNEKKQHKWAFSRAERCNALEKVFNRKGDVGLGQALIEYVPKDHLNVNIMEEDDKTGKKNNIPKRDSVQGTSKPSNWLQRAAAQGDVKWVELFASRGANQSMLNNGLKVALESTLIQRTEIVGVLLSYGADPNHHVDAFLQAIQMVNRPLLEKFLISAKVPLIEAYLAQGLSLAVSIGSYPTVSLLLSNGADCNNVFNETIHAAIQLFDTKMLCTLLLGSLQKPIQQPYLQKAVSAACALPEDQIKVQVLDLLLSYGASVNDPNFHDILLAAIEKNNLDLLSMLVSHRVLENVEESRTLDSEALRLAVTKLKYDALRALLRRPMSKLSVSTAMDMIPPSASEDHAIQIITILGEHPYEVGSCGRILARAVKQHEMTLLNLLLTMSPSIGFQDAQVVRMSLQRQDIPLFEQLLERGICPPPILSKVILDVFHLEHPEMRKLAIFRLIEKGIVAPEIDVALQRFIEPEFRDLDVITALLTAGASVNYAEGTNCVLAAAQNGDLECLTQLCQANPPPSDATLSAALPFAFAGLKKLPYETVLGMMQLLLPEEIAPTEQISQTLISALREDERHQVIYLLLKRGADVNYENGLAFEIAYKLPDPRPWQLLCNSGRMNPAVYAQLLPQALENADSDPLRTSTLLKCGNQHQSVLSQLLVEEARTKCRKEVLAMLMKYGADVDYNQGHAISQAIGRNSIEGVQILLERKPNQASLAQAFTTARRVSSSPQYRADLYESILAAPYTGAPVNEALIEAISKGELKVVNLLLDHGASVDFDQGRPLILAIQTESQPVLDILLARNPHPEAIVMAFNKARQSSMTEQRRTGLFTSLLRYNIPSQYKNAALLEAVTRGCKSLDLFRLLQTHKASLDFEEGKALCLLISRGDVETTAFLLENGTVDTQTLDYAFNTAMTSPLGKKLRLAFAKLFLPVSNVEMAKHLPQAVQDGDHDLLELLVKSGANPGLNRESVQSAALNGDFKSLKTLLALVAADDDVVNDAFQDLLDQKTVEGREDGINVAEILLKKGVNRHLQSRALVDAFTYEKKRDEFVNLMLQYEPDVNVADGKCFMYSSSMNDLGIFDKMLEMEPKLDVIVPALISSGVSEDRLMELLERCFASGASFEMWSSKLVFQALDQYPSSEALMRLLIKNGCSPGETEDLKLDPRSEREAVTPLIWALTRPRPGVRDSVILALLDAGDEAQPNLITEATETSAVIKAVQSSRHEIIQKLIALGAEVDIRDAQERFPLFYASSLGDSRAVHQLIAAGARPDDGSLHEAARELHMGIVEQLVAAGHSPNAPSEHHGGRTPLAELCLHARPEGRQWESRARKVMEVLLTVTPADRKYQDLDSTERKNVLHLAIDNPAGFEVVRCLLGFRQIYDNLSSDDFLFEDSSSICYSPTKYVQHFYVGSERSEMKQKLIRLLKSRNCEDRYFKLRGAQPQGYIGLPKFMMETDRRNMIEYQKHEEDMKRLRERAELEMELSNRQTTISLRQEATRHKQMLEQASALEAVENTKRANLLEYNKQSADQQLSLDTARWLTEHEHADRKRQADFSQANRMANLKTDSSERQARIQERLLERGDESVRRRAEEFKRLVNISSRNPGIAPPSMPNLLTETPD